MDKKIMVVGGNKLYGTLHNQTSKNAVLPIMAGAILNDGVVTLHNVPNLLDIQNMAKILEDLGVKATFVKKNNADLDSNNAENELFNNSINTLHNDISIDKLHNDISTDILHENSIHTNTPTDNQTNNTVTDLVLDCSNIDKLSLDAGLSKALRSSIFLLGPMLARFKKATVCYPGGCDIGNRPIDLHLAGLKELGVKIIERHSLIFCDGTKMHANTIHLDFPSVGATENLMMSSVFLKGKTKIFNSAKEPEIVDLQNFLNSMGAKISGAGTSEITIQGVESLHNTQYMPIGDRIVAGTYLIACAMTGGEITIDNIVPEHLYSLIHKLKKAGCDIETTDNSINIKSTGELKSINLIETTAYPGFPTDLQAQIMAMETISSGVNVLIENIFENRYKHASEFIKMGADVIIKDRVAVVRGVQHINGSPVEASDLRGGASLVLAGLVANGYTTISNIFHITRGYEDIVRDLASLGADIKYVE